MDGKNIADFVDKDILKRLAGIVFIIIRTRKRRRNVRWDEKSIGGKLIRWRNRPWINVSSRRNKK